ncbi:MAG: family 43 glycosylhydrolase [Solirubrobacteraceae bacterium MAG38_C4-C5]|nr:family 43 glycosylhydrolase [Candidatus Siliceabacter maunaloa]
MRAGSGDVTWGAGRPVIRLAGAGLLGALGLALAPGAAQAQFSNPLFMPDPPSNGSADPGVSFLEGQYRVTSTAGPRVRTSPDLVNWKEEQPLFAPGGEPQWVRPDPRTGARRAGSPKIYELSDRADGPGRQYVLLFSAPHKDKGKGCIGRAVSNTPHSFRNAGRKSKAGPLECKDNGDFGLIDPALFVDHTRGGKHYLLYKRQLKDHRKKEMRRPSDIVIRPINTDVRRGLGSSTRLVVGNGKGEVGSVEAPTMVRHDGRYFLFYSVGLFSNDSYAVSVAVSRRDANRPTGGKFIKYRENPIYSGRGTGDFCGVGHQDVRKNPDGTWRLFAHANLRETNPAKPPDARNKCVKSRRDLVSETLRWDRRTSNPNFHWPSVSNGKPSGNGKTTGTFAPFMG